MPERSNNTRANGRVVETSRQKRDRLAMLLPQLEPPRGDEVAAARARAVDVVRLAEEVGDRAAGAYGLRALALCDVAEGAPERAPSGLLRVLRVLDELNEEVAAAETLLLLSRVRSMVGDVLGATDALHDARRRWDALNDNAGRALAATALGNLYTDAADYPRALECYTEALELRRTGTPHAADELLGMSYYDLAMVHAATGNEERALELLAQSIAQFESVGAYRLQARAHAAIGALYNTLQDTDAALAASLRALVLLETTGDHEGVAETLMTMAAIHEKCGSLRDAHALARKALSFAERAARPNGMAAALVALGRLERRMGDGWAAVASLERALVVAAELNDRVLLCRAHETLAAAYEALGVADKALEQYRCYMALHEELRDAENRRAIAEIEGRHALRDAERERERYREEAGRLQAALDERTRELASMELGAVHKSRALDLLAKRLTARFENTPKARPFLRDVLEEIAALGDTTDEWSVFEERLDEVHRDFMTLLRARFPELTPTELQVCALLRANFNSRDVAGILCLSERTIENHRYRLRRKFNLSADENLSVYLGTL